jgi:hypothetical protein
MILRRLVGTATFAGLAGAVGLSLGWVLVADGASLLEASAQMLALLAALTGIVAERLAAERQRRRLALTALTDELLKNQAIIGDLRFTLGKTARRRVYPRLLISAADGVITSGVLAVGGDRELFSKLHHWRNEVADFNRRLDLTEMLTFLQGTPEAIRGLERALGRDDGRLHRVTRLLQELLDYLDENYGSDLRRPAGHDRTPARRMAVVRPMVSAVTATDDRPVSPGPPDPTVCAETQCSPAASEPASSAVN